MALRSENYRSPDHAQADRSLHHVGWIALRAFAYHGTPLEIWTSRNNPTLPACGGRPLPVFVVLGLSGAERNAYIAGEPAHDAVSSPPLHTCWRIRDGIRGRKQCGWQRRDCRMFCSMALPPSVLPRQWQDTHRRRRCCHSDNPHKWKVIEDKVGPHGNLLAEFPYLGPPHNA